MPIPPQSHMTDDEFLAALDNCTLDAQHFNHLGHLRLAWLHLQRYDVDEAVARTCKGSVPTDSVYKFDMNFLATTCMESLSQ
jgi:hypothetical protein